MLSVFKCIYDHVDIWLFLLYIVHSWVDFPVVSQYLKQKDKKKAHNLPRVTCLTNGTQSFLFEIISKFGNFLKFSGSMVYEMAGN